jgi:hypothetical protein
VGTRAVRLYFQDPDGVRLELLVDPLGELPAAIGTPIIIRAVARARRARLRG